ncbi:permease [Anaerosacchariphilus polymeriproducens]|uniref:Permease n=1 Tax=Anaerosacchariphilus polymeriproducens TaxID=1812858 RepID=A0A371AXY4_9FIRM|nr:permease [Anaerosacchariphilus polymeriproducens]RDU24409.1 permease [Anaerosacchariphilus polymeriproducens]
MFTVGMYVFTLILLLLSFLKSRSKTKEALKKAWRSFENILPLFLAILLIVGIILSILSPEVISKILGSQSGVLGIILAGIIGSCTVIPGFVTFPLAAALLKNGAGLIPIIVLVSTSAMVGILTIPIELQYFCKKSTYVRNFLAIIFSFIIAFIMGVILG